MHFWESFIKNWLMICKMKGQKIKSDELLVAEVKGQEKNPQFEQH